MGALKTTRHLKPIRSASGTRYDFSPRGRPLAHARGGGGDGGGGGIVLHASGGASPRAEQLIRITPVIYG
jgi:hypothetical protein